MGDFQTDNEFRNAFDAKVSDIANAASEAYGGLSPGDPDVIVQPWGEYGTFAGGSSDAAENVEDALKISAVPAMKKEAEGDIGSALRTIWDAQINDWDGDAATAFRGWLTDLANALQLQHDFLVAMQGIMRCKREMHYAKRKQVLAIGNQVEASIREEDAKKHEQMETGLEEVTTVAFGGAVGFATAGPIGAVTGALTALGTQLTGVVVAVFSNDAGVVAAVTKEAFESLRSDILDEQRELNKGIGELADMLAHKHEDLLPRQVGQ